MLRYLMSVTTLMNKSEVWNEPESKLGLEDAKFNVNVLETLI